MALFIVEETVQAQVSSQLVSGTWQTWQSAKVGALMKIQTCVHSEGCKWDQSLALTPVDAAELEPGGTSRPIPLDLCTVMLYEVPNLV